jgi:hypothetical protein
MADTQNSAEPSFQGVIDSIVELIRSGVRPEVLEAQRVLLQRLANQGDVFPARIPAPRNITELGGYLNLLENAGLTDVRASAVASALGVAGPPPQVAALSGVVPVGFVEIANDRPSGAAQASIPPLLSLRADFAAPLQTALATLHAAGCALPLRAPRAELPANQSSGSPSLDLATVLAATGRVIEVFPGTVLVDPALDALAIARPETPVTEPLRLVARELDGGSTVPEASWVARRASASAASDDPAANRRYLEVAPIMQTAGWNHPSPLALPLSRTERGSLVRFINLTGLVSGETSLGAELALLYSPPAIARSSLSSLAHFVWDGSTFAPPS